MAEVSLPRVRIPHPHVRCDPSVLAGSPHVDGSRVPVRRLWAWHRGGASVETLVKRYPNLGAARILDALAFAYDNQELIEADIAREHALFEKQGPSVGARPLSQLALFSRVDSDLTTSCGIAGQPEATLRWTAPATRRYSFVVGGSASARAIVALRDGVCGGTELACAEHEVSVDLAMGQSVVIVIEGVGCHELDIR